MLVPCALCGSGTRKFKNCEGDYLTKTFHFNLFLCYHLEIMRETEAKVLRPFSYQGLENISSTIFLESCSICGLDLTQKLFLSAKCSFLLSHHPLLALFCLCKLLFSESRKQNTPFDSLLVSTNEVVVQVWKDVIFPVRSLCPCLLPMLS